MGEPTDSNNAGATVFAPADLTQEDRVTLHEIVRRLTEEKKTVPGTQSEDPGKFVFEKTIISFDDLSPSEKVAMDVIRAGLQAEEFEAVERKPTVKAGGAEETPDLVDDQTVEEAGAEDIPAIGDMLDAPEPKAKRKGAGRGHLDYDNLGAAGGELQSDDPEPPVLSPNVLAAAAAKAAETAAKKKKPSVGKGAGSKPAKREHTLPPDDGPQPPMVDDAVQPEPASPPPIGEVKPTAVEAEVEEDPDAESPTATFPNADLKNAVNADMQSAAAEAAKNRPAPVPIAKPQIAWEPDPVEPDNGQQNQAPDPNATQAQSVDQPASAPPATPIIPIPQGGPVADKKKKSWPWKSVLGGIMMILLLLGAGSLMALGLVTASGGVYWYKSAEPKVNSEATATVDADPPAEAPEVNLPPAVPDEPVPPPPVTFATMNVAGSYPEGTGMCANVIVKNEVATKAGREDLTVCGDNVTVKGGTVKVGNTTLTAGHFMEGITGQKGPALQDFKILGADVYCSGDAPACTPK